MLIEGTVAEIGQHRYFFIDRQYKILRYFIAKTKTYSNSGICSYTLCWDTRLFCAPAHPTDMCVSN